jgi:signal peptidase I
VVAIRVGKSRPPRRGEVVVVRDPENPALHEVKRVIGLPNEKVEITGGAISINGRRLWEPYPIRPEVAPHSEGNWELSSTHYFLLGDNRSFSTDSRQKGPLAADLLVGRVCLRYFPWRNRGLVHSSKAWAPEIR